ncbi:alpha/beta hydrolase [Chitinolyticbacter albus]|uniref:alpha/beta hydrolase n=1 Tax=Chitinolyticbacter albus TaxID=2961951 RepID=UPI00210E6DFA|nr:alpha/beta fold hydrolase [Chitinolyticbacter albus]
MPQAEPQPCLPMAATLPRKSRLSAKRVLSWLLLVPVLALLSVFGYFFLYQEQMIFFPPKPDVVAARKLAQPEQRAQTISVATPDGQRLHGWLLHADTDEPAPTLIFFGGNDEEVSWFAGKRHFFKYWNILLMNYRGYGRSTGHPSERAMQADALTIYDAISHHPGVDNSKIVALGRSLGTGVAVYLAQQRPLAGVVLISPYDSVRDVAQEIYPFLPVGLLLKHPFDSASRAPGIHAPVLMVVADQDGYIKPAHSRRLFDAWAGPKQWKNLADANHNNIVDRTACWSAVSTFLDQLNAADSRNSNARHAPY